MLNPGAFLPIGLIRHRCDLTRCAHETTKPASENFTGWLFE
jgi:hypothetical protein